MLAPYAPRFIEPTAPDARPIIELHRNNDGFVAFQRRTAKGQFESVLSVRASELPEMFPEFIAPHVDEDSFFTVNAMHISEKRQKDRAPIDARFPRAQWGTSKLRHLTACYIDLDCYKLGLTIGQCIGQCIDAQDRGVFPPASIFTRSGRGVWLFWLLRDDDDERAPVRAWPEKISTYRRIERQLLRMFGELGADAQAVDPARITRVPGSLHRGAGKRVDYWVQHDRQGKPITYRLNELAVLLGTRPTKYTAGIRKLMNPAFAERGKKGYEALHRQTLEKFMRLIAERGTIAEGCRNHAALILSVTQHRLRNSGIDEAERVSNVEKFGRMYCTPPLTEAEIADAIHKGREPYKFEKHTIADWLKITPAESELVGWPAANTRPAESDTRLRTRAEHTTARRTLILYTIEHATTPPTVRQLADHIEAVTGNRPSTQTVHKDLGLLGIENPRAWKRDQDGADQGPMLLPPVAG